MLIYVYVCLLVCLYAWLSLGWSIWLFDSTTGKKREMVITQHKIGKAILQTSIEGYITKGSKKDDSEHDNGKKPP